MADAKRHWLGAAPARCDVCGTAIALIFYDARVPSANMWGCICPGCFILEGCRTGTGHGQKYELQMEDGKWLKTAG